MSEQNFVRVISFSKDRRTAMIVVVATWNSTGKYVSRKTYYGPSRRSVTLHVERVSGNVYRSRKVDAEGNAITYTLI